ncbi:hypothetical protein GW931_04190 [archaeon]|nr:hypothetical protein [archaeon]
MKKARIKYIYRKGRYYERKTRIKLKKDGFYTIRSAASKGIVDIVAFNNQELILIQVKSGASQFTKKAERQFLRLPVPLGVKKALWSWKLRRDPIIKIIK